MFVNSFPIRLGLLGIAVFLSCAQPARAESTTQSLEAIRDAARQYVEALHKDASSNIVVDPGYIDSRLRLAKCDVPLQASSAGVTRRNADTSVKVQCPGSWRLFVPVKVKFQTSVVVLEAPVARGSVLQARHLATRVRDVSRLAHGYYQQPAQAIGQVMRRPGVPGTVLTPSMLEPAVMVRKGQTVRLVVSARSFQVNASGRALEDAVEGQRLQVRNLSSERIIEGVVIGPETVEIR